MPKTKDSGDDMALIDDLELSSKEENEKIEEETKENKNGDTVAISKSKLVLVNNLLHNMAENSRKISDLLAGTLSADEEERISIGQMGEEKMGYEADDADQAQEGRIVEGVFDGENMIGPDGKQYSVPANYASKSKLVEGDILKLTITPNGTFVYKQIGPIDRARRVGTLVLSSNGSHFVESEDRKWQVLTASVTYYKGQPGDEVVILIPKQGESKWAAVENIVKRNQ